jgi:hypothetical protein
MRCRRAETGRDQAAIGSEREEPMTNRRQFLQIGITAGAWPLASRAAKAAGVDFAARTSIPLYKAIYDERFAHSVEFARRARTLGLPVQPIDGDMTRFWYDDLYHQWRREPAAIAGLTAHGAMFCFEQLAHEKGMRAVFRAEHEFTADAVRHRMFGPSQLLDDCLALQGSGQSWPACFAETVAHCPSGRAEMSTAAGLSPPSSDDSADGEKLYSWVIAPAARA